MDSSGLALKRGRPDPDVAANGNGAHAGSKKSKDMQSIHPGVGSKSKPCTKFFSVAGCPFGEGCHFLHYVPGGINAVAQMDLPSRSPITGPVHHPDGPSPRAVKTRICNNFTSPEGCRFGDKCHFAHGERELGQPINSAHGPSNRADPTSFGASATAKISIDASLAGAVIGKGGVNAKQICRLTGAKLTIQDHETDQGLRNIELEGSFDQIKEASGMVRELIVSISSAGSMVAPLVQGSGSYKTKLCENFAKGPCTFGDRCKFAHGASELRKA